MTTDKIRIAFIKFGGLAAGGTEKYLQTLACNLPKNEFEVDYYYTDNVSLIGNSWKHPQTDIERKKYMIDHDINLVCVDLEARDDRHGAPYPWVNTNFWKLFKAEDYDIVQTGRSGYTEYPFCEMHQSRFVDSIHSFGADGIERRENIIKTVLLSEPHAEGWLANGGEESKLVIIPPLVEFPPRKDSTLRKDLNIGDDVAIFGMHQGNRDDIFSSIPLEAYSLIENDEVFFAMLGGSDKYKSQASSLGIKNIKFLPFTGDALVINNFVAGLDIFSHGRRDGEACSAAIIEALYHGKPIITHPGLNMGHASQVEGCGFMANTISDYAFYMRGLLTNRGLYDIMSKAAFEKYETFYSLNQSINKYTKLYKEVASGQ